MKAKEITINYLANELNLSDTQISKLFNVTRSSICHFRRDHNIKKPQTLGRFAELLAIEELNKLGHSTLDMNVRDKTSLYDILVDGKIKVEVKASSLNKNGRYYFTLANKKECGHIESDIRIRYKTGRTRKKYEVTTDYFIFVGVTEQINFWVIPTNEIDAKAQCISIGENSKKYERYRNNFLGLRGDKR